MQLAEPKQFMMDDPGYLDWLGDNPEGYVVNYMGGPKPYEPVLHRATCRTINGKPPSGTSWTGTWLKACSTDPDSLRDWVRSQGGDDPRPCRVCAP